MIIMDLNNNIPSLRSDLQPKNNPLSINPRRTTNHQCRIPQIIKKDVRLGASLTTFSIKRVSHQSYIVHLTWSAQSYRSHRETQLAYLSLRRNRSSAMIRSDRLSRTHFHFPHHVQTYKWTHGTRCACTNRSSRRWRSQPCSQHSPNAVDFILIYFICTVRRHIWVEMLSQRWKK